MSKRTDLEELQIRVQTLGDLLDDHHGNQVSCTDALAIARAATRKAVRLAEEANERAARAEQQVADRDSENVTLAKEMETAVAALSHASDTVLTIRRVIAEHIALGLGHPATSVLMQTQMLQSEMDLAGCSVDQDVKVLRALGDAS